MGSFSFGAGYFAQYSTNTTIQIPASEITGEIVAFVPLSHIDGEAPIMKPQGSAESTTPIGGSVQVIRNE
jgi:hypothetical protein